MASDIDATAVELEAIATVRSLQALATIEVANEVEAAVATHVILTLVEAGYIEQAAAVIDAALIQQALANGSD